MNSTVKTVLLTLLTLSALTIAMIEVSGISTTRLSDLFSSSETPTETTESPEVKNDPNAVKKEREAQMRDMEQTEIEVEEQVHVFERIKEGDKARHTYKVKNIGDKPLFIANVQVSCGCTAPEFSKDPVLPGQIGEVTLEFNSAGKAGHQKKNALIICNASNAPYSIGFEVDVDKK